MILDSSIVIDYLRGRAAAMTFVNSLGSTGILRTHCVVVGEVLFGARNRSEQDDIDRFFSGFIVEPIVSADCTTALDLLRQFRLSHNLSLPDAFIAATSLRLQVPVATLNDKHFSMIPGLSALRPY
jgi:predicted nucleic acid-binding protein